MTACLTVEDVQCKTNQFVEEIRTNLGISLEAIVIKEAALPVDKIFGIEVSRTAMQTNPGEIEVDFHNFGIQDYESYLLHELGHRATHIINPEFSILKSEFLPTDLLKIPILGRIIAVRKIARSLLGIKELSESIAECFADDIFPDHCTLSDKARRAIKSRRNYLLRDSLGAMEYPSFRLIHGIHADFGEKGIVSYIEHIQDFRPPTKRDFSHPFDYIKEHYAFFARPQSKSYYD